MGATPRWDLIRGWAHRLELHALGRVSAYAACLGIAAGIGVRERMSLGSGKDLLFYVGTCTVWHQKQLYNCMASACGLCSIF